VSYQTLDFAPPAVGDRVPTTAEPGRRSQPGSSMAGTVCAPG
jgi:hypothetical protein